MKKFLLLMVICLFFVIQANSGLCETDSYSRFISPMVGGHLFEGNEGLDNGPTFGLGIGTEYDGLFGWEAMINYSDSDIDPGSSDVDVVVYRVDGFYNLLKETAIIPYVAAGVGGLNYDIENTKKDKFMMNYGAGIKWFVSDSVALRGDVRHLIAFNDSYNNLLYTFGLSWFFDIEKQPAKPCPRSEAKEYMVTPVAAVDEDQDNDGVVDAMDKCPDTPAGAIVDEDGCPVDGDGDGIPDYLDDCLNTPLEADVNEYGCWIIKATLFETDKWNIDPKYYGTLDEVARVMEKNPDLKLEIEGHADERGTAEYNQKLSEKRAKSVEEYLISKGIASDRMSSVGYGFTRPVATNDTVEGMAKNRRVEINSIRILFVE